MRAGIVAIVFLSMSALPSAAASCRAGETVTLEGEIIIPPVFDRGEWFWPGKFAKVPCSVTTLRGKGPLPKECGVGKRMALTGRVIEDGILILDVASVKCF